MGHRHWSAAEQETIWEQWKGGASVQVIADAVGCSPRAIRRQLRRAGGIAPPPRGRAPQTLSSAEREEISRGLAAADAFAAIGRRLQRACSTISREVRRHGGREAYRAGAADAEAWADARRPKRCRLARLPRLRRVVARRLAQGWSPEQIAGWLRVTYPDTPDMQISHEAIYRTLFVQSRGALKRELQQHLRRPRTMRRPRGTAPPVTGPLADAVSIRDRPASVEDRAVPGHWEGDLLAGTIHSQVATLVERQSRFVLLVRTPTKAAPDVARALARQMGTLPRVLRRSLTWDRGRELAAHRDFTIATDIHVYFCDPHSPWQRGSNENTNGLLRQYLPHGADFSHYSQTDLNRIARQLNERPRKTLGFKTPADMLAQIVASTG